MPQSAIPNPQSLVGPAFQPVKDRVKGRSHKRGFSLIEMMVAIVILGLGLVMVATVFPVAWSRARKLSEFTSQQGVAGAAEATADLLARVDGLDSNAGSFAGGLIYSVRGLDPTFPFGGFVSFSDTRVHALHLENIAASNPQRFVWEKPWRIELANNLISAGLNWGDPPADTSDLPESYYDSLFLWPQVRFEARVYPPLRPRENVGQEYVNGYRGYRVFSGSDAVWADTLQGRRYAWAVFHRLRDYVGPNPTVPSPPGQTPESQAEEAIASPRTFDMYYVTLRRPNPTNRYARQDPDPAFLPDPNNRGRPVPVQALGPDGDVRLPVPWRVQILLPENLGGAPLGVPTEVQVGGTADLGTSPFTVGLFRNGTPFIDEVNGSMYRVVKRRVAADGLFAHLTLDAQILLSDVDDGPGGMAGNGIYDVPEERLRAVWVFPLAVEAGRVANEPVFKGSQPVVGIDIRTLTVPAYD